MIDFNIWSEQFAGLNSFFNSFQEQIKPYAEAWKVMEQNLRNALSDFVEKTKPIRAFYILAEHQFTYWKPLTYDEIEKIISSYDIDKYLSERIADAKFIDYDALCEEMVSSELLSATNKFILQQAFKAVETGLYDLALVGVVIVFDGVLSEATCDTSTNLSKRIADIKKRVENMLDEEWECLEESEITMFGMYITWTQTMEGLQVSSAFDMPETEPKGLNRHWIAHGRKTTIATKLDCCKMINALYGLFYFGNTILPVT